MTPLFASFLSEEKTLYSIVDETGERTTITIDKFVADVLQMHLPDVHTWLQTAYNKVVVKRPELSRRQMGNVVRALARREAEKTSVYMHFMNDLESSL